MERELYTIAVCVSDIQWPDYKGTSYGVGGWPESDTVGRVFISSNSCYRSQPSIVRAASGKTFTLTHTGRRKETA